MNAKKLGVILFLVAVMILGLVACEMSAPATTPGGDPATTPNQPTTPPANNVSVIYMSNGVEYFTDSVEEGAKATAPTAPEVLGKEFKGWFNDAGCTDEFDFETPITKTTILYAKFDVVTYTITYDLTDHANDVDGEGNPAVTNPNIVAEYTVEKAVTFKRAFTSSMWCTWVDQDGNEVTTTEGLAKNLVLSAVWSKKPYINLDFEDAIIHYADNKGTEIAIDGTHQIYKNAQGAAANPNLYIMSEYKYDETTGYIVLDFGVPTLMEAFKNTHNPMYIRNDKDAYGNYFCIILDHDLTDGSQKEDHYFDKNGNKLDHAAMDKTNNTYLYPGVYYSCAYNEHYNVSALCRLQNKDVTEQTVSLSFDFYFEKGGLFPISFYMRDDTKATGKAFNGNRTNLAALMPNGNISIGVDTVGNAGRLSYKDAEGNTIATEQVLGTAKVGEWNHIEFVMTKTEAGTNYEVKILLNSEDITPSGALNLYVADMTWGNANMFMIFGGGASYAVNALDKDLVYKFDNIVLEGVEAE